MEYGPHIGRDFYDRPCLEVAAELVGLILVRRLESGVVLAGRIVEVEAYLGQGRDCASHAHRGPTPRNQSMFGPPGKLYVYRSYGIHCCANLVCEPPGAAAAVLLRAVEPLAGLDQMRRARGLDPARPAQLIASGPGRLSQAFGIDRQHDGHSATRGAISVRRPHREAEPAPEVVACPRIGISKATASPFRFCARDSPHLSRPAP